MRGRRPVGPEAVERLTGSPQAKQRLRVVLETLAGRLRVQEACQQLGIGEVRFHALRQTVLTAALTALEPRPLGRPPRDPDAATPARAALQEQVEGLSAELQASQLREEIALILGPRPTEPALEKKTRRPRATGRPGKRNT